jgi:hypothetical protein
VCEGCGCGGDCGDGCDGGERKIWQVNSGGFIYLSSLRKEEQSWIEFNVWNAHIQFNLLLFCKSMGWRDVE